MIGPNGEISLDMALQAFSIAIGPLPGVTVPPGPEPSPAEIGDGSGPVRWLFAHASELTPGQLAAAENLVGGSAAKDVVLARFATDEALIPVPIGDCALMFAGNGFRPPTTPDFAPYVEAAAVAIDALGTHMGRPLGINVRFCPRRAAGFAFALALPTDDGNGLAGKAADCWVYVDVRGVPLTSVGKADVAHLMADCYVAAEFSTLTEYYIKSDSWLIEGFESWAASTVALEAFGSVETAAAYWWDTYLLASGDPLIRRVNDAIGFFAELNDVFDVWTVIHGALMADAPGSQFDALGAQSDGFLERWPSGYFRSPDHGPDWDMNGPGITASPQGGFIPTRVENGSSELTGSPAFAGRARVLMTSADVTTFEPTDGRAHVSDGTTDVAFSSAAAFCTKASHDCECPPDTARAGYQFVQLNNGADWALSAGTEQGMMTIAGKSLDDFCGPRTQGQNWTLLIWPSPKSPVLSLAGYTCSGLHGDWHFILYPGYGPARIEKEFDLSYRSQSSGHVDYHFDVTTKGDLPIRQTFDLSFDLVLGDAPTGPAPSVATGPTMTVAGTSHLVQIDVRSGMVVEDVTGVPEDLHNGQPVSLLPETLNQALVNHPELKHPFRTQSIADCGG
jgi:hypothetical protein